MNSIESYASLLAHRGISLASLGLMEVALDRVTALSAIELLASGNVPILGGDVYVEKQGRIEFGFSNWYTDPQDEELHDVFLTRSWDESRLYVSKFPELPNGRVLFVLVIGDG